MKWTKICRIFCPQDQNDWMVSHASNPVPCFLPNGLCRIYFSSRDKQRRSHIGYVEIDIHKPHEILNISPTPVLAPGKQGLFDDSGVTLGCIVSFKHQQFLYYLGWNLAVTVPWRNSIGLATSQDQEIFQKHSIVPILDRSAVDPYSISYPWVMSHRKGWRMWYGSNLGWEYQGRKMAFVIKYAESSNGIDWERSGKIAIDLKHGEAGVSRPCVIYEDGIYKMWFSCLTDTYRIGYAESHDGVGWERKDSLAGIDVSQTGWDSEMVEYPYVFDHENQRYMLYNGNNYGKTGFGLAILDN